VHDHEERCDCCCRRGGGAGFPAEAAPGQGERGRFRVVLAPSSYGPDRAQRVTIHRPDAGGRRPVAFMLHGGGWMAGSRSAWSKEASLWASRGWIVVNADYSRGVSDGIPGDGRRIIADVRTVVRKYAASGRADRSRMVIVGDSAGGHLATLTAARDRGWFRAAIAWSPVVVPANVVIGAAAPGASLSALAARAGWHLATSTAPSSVTPIRCWPNGHAPGLRLSPADPHRLLS